MWLICGLSDKILSIDYKSYGQICIHDWRGHRQLNGWQLHDHLPPQFQPLWSTRQHLLRRICRFIQIFMAAMMSMTCKLLVDHLRED